MSFILDALKKSENERQRTIGPSLTDAPLRQHRIDRPWWALVVGALLIVNLGVLLIVLTRDNEQPAPAAATIAPAVAAPATTMPAVNVPTRPPTPVARPQPGNSSATAVSPAVRSLAEEADDGYADAYLADGEAFDAPSHPDLAVAAKVPPGPSIVRQVEAPAVAPLAPGAAASAARLANESTESLPTLNALTATGVALPDLHLDIHVYSAKPAERFVFVNMRKYHEGDTLSEGPTVERITPDGTVLSQQGQRFLLPRQ